MKVWLVFEDWKRKGKSVYEKPEGEGLTLGPFHHSTSWRAELEMEEGVAEDLKEAIKNGFTPVFAIDFEELD